MCSCKTKKVGCEVDFTTKENVQTELSKYQALTDTSNVLKIEIDKSKLTITETIITKKYDKDTGTITEETKTERKVAQDSDKVVAEEENQSVIDCNLLEVDQFREVTKKVDSEVKEESRSDLGMFLAQIGKSLGIIMGIALIVGLIGLYLKRKFSS
jgi:hypothetical protein